MAHRNSPYNTRQTVASLAAKLAKKTGSKAPALFVLTDPKRVPDIIGMTQRLPKESVLIYRHFGDPNKTVMAAQLRQICFARGAKLLIGKDAQLAIRCGADGVHFPQRDMGDAKKWAKHCPDWMLTAAVHNAAAIKLANTQPLNAVLLSAVFPSQSQSAGTPLGVRKFNALAEQSIHPVIALGGINQQSGAKLLGGKAAGLAGISGVLD